jgi:hypothetical protein
VCGIATVGSGCIYGGLGTLLALGAHALGARGTAGGYTVIDAKKLRGGWQGCIWQRPFIRSCTPSKLPPDLHVLNECHIRVLELIPTQIRWLGISAGAVVTAGRLLLAA